MPILPREDLKFTPTAHSSAEDKMRFYEHFKKFMLADCPRSMFPKWFYNRLSDCFGHIAHYNLEGFYSVWFGSDIAKLRFIQNALRFPCHGQPEYTYCDVEKHLVIWLTVSDLQDKYASRHNAAVDSSERATLARLRAKYGET